MSFVFIISSSSSVIRMNRHPVKFNLKETERIILKGYLSNMARVMIISLWAFNCQVGVLYALSLKIWCNRQDLVRSLLYIEYRVFEPQNTEFFWNCTYSNFGYLKQFSLPLIWAHGYLHFQLYDCVFFFIPCGPKYYKLF